MGCESCNSTTHKAPETLPKDATEESNELNNLINQAMADGEIDQSELSQIITKAQAVQQAGGQISLTEDQQAALSSAGIDPDQLVSDASSVQMEPSYQ
jgi:uncharacterized membrane protein YebE (DUF533 family)